MGSLLVTVMVRVDRDCAPALLLLWSCMCNTNRAYVRSYMIVAKKTSEFADQTGIAVQMYARVHPKVYKR